MSETKTTTRKTRAFLIEQCEQKIDDAAHYGEICEVFAQQSSRPSALSPRYQDVLTDALADVNFDPDVDYIIATGAFVLVNISVAVIVAKYGRVRMLCFDAREGNYIPVDIRCMWDGSEF